MSIRRVALASLFALVPGSPAPAQDIAPGVQYTGQATLSAPEYGASFVLPAGWVGMLPEGGEFFVMRSQQFDAYIFAAIDEMTVEAARKAMGEPIALGDGLVLRPSGPVQAAGRVLTADYDVAGARQPLAGHVRTTVGEHGLGLSLIAAAEPEHASRLRDAVRTIGESLTLARPAPEPAAAPPPRGGGAWADALRGRKLSYFFTRTGYTEEDYLWLCPDGRFFHSAQSGGFGGGASGAFQSSNAGRWSASGPPGEGTLVLSYNDGRTARYALTLDGTKLFLDGKRYFRESSGCA